MLCCEKVCLTNYSFKSPSFVPTVLGTAIESLSEKGEKKGSLLVEVKMMTDVN